MLLEYFNIHMLRYVVFFGLKRKLLPKLLQKKIFYNVNEIEVRDSRALISQI